MGIHEREKEGINKVSALRRKMKKGFPLVSMLQ